MDRVIIVDFVASVDVVVALAIPETYGNLHRIGAVGTGVVIPATAANIQLSAE
jgi:hypothetical protein